MTNTAKRILVSAIAIPVILAVCYFGRIPFLLFTLIIGLVSYHEFYTMSRNKEISPNLIAGLLAVFLIILNNYYNFIDFFALSLLIVSLLVLLELFRNQGSAIINLGVSLLGILYLGLFASSILLIREFFSDEALLYPQGGYLIISILASIWICDSAAFFLGTAFGKHKLFPRVSPKKSWEGAAAGFVFAILTMIAAKAIILDFFTTWDVIFIGIIVGTIGQMGDLVESLLKRDAEVKDSSSLIPGHGGIFDRFDSLLLSAPFIYLYLVYFY